MFIFDLIVNLSLFLFLVCSWQYFWMLYLLNILYKRKMKCLFFDLCSILALTYYSVRRTLRLNGIAVQIVLGTMWRLTLWLKSPPHVINEVFRTITAGQMAKLLVMSKWKGFPNVFQSSSMSILSSFTHSHVFYILSSFFYMQKMTFWGIGLLFFKHYKWRFQGAL